MPEIQLAAVMRMIVLLSNPALFSSSVKEFVINPRLIRGFLAHRLPSSGLSRSVQRSKKRLPGEYEPLLAFGELAVE